MGELDLPLDAFKVFSSLSIGNGLNGPQLFSQATFIKGYPRLKLDKINTFRLVLGEPGESFSFLSYGPWRFDQFGENKK